MDTNDDGIINPLELGRQLWVNGRLIQFHCGGSDFTCGLSGEIPSEIWEMTNLTILRLQYNQLTGEIPPEIGNLINLTNLYLYNNQLSGEIPQEVCDLIESNHLSMDGITSGNNLTNTCE